MLVAIVWYYAWSFYVGARPHSPYFDATYNPIPEACGESTFPATIGYCKFAESAVVAVPALFEDVRGRVQQALETKSGVKYSGPQRFGGPPLHEARSCELVGLPYKRTPDLGPWKAINGSSFLLGSVVSARSLGQPDVTFVELSRADHWSSWAGREFHTGIQFPFPVRVDNSRDVFSSTELELLKEAFGSFAGPLLVCPGWNAWRDEAALKALAEQAAQRK
jgi:hypothetical protein